MLESKNYSGWIFGNEDDRYWTAMMPNKQKNRFYNPILQNKTHMKWLAAYVGEDIPLFSIVVFSERCELKKVTVHSDVRVIKRDDLYSIIRDIWDKSPDLLSKERVEELYDKLKICTNVSKEEKKEHIDNIRRRYGKNVKEGRENYTETLKQEIQSSQPGKPEKESEGESDQQNSIESNPTCPWCGRPLVLRTAKKGTNAGKQFWDAVDSLIAGIRIRSDVLWATYAKIL